MPAIHVRPHSKDGSVHVDRAPVPPYPAANPAGLEGCRDLFDHSQARFDLREAEMPLGPEKQYPPGSRGLIQGRSQLREMRVRGPKWSRDKKHRERIRRELRVGENETKQNS